MANNQNVWYYGNSSNNNNIIIGNDLTVQGDLTANDNNLIDVNILTVGLTGSGADYEVTSTEDLGATINGIVNFGRHIQIYKGDYKVSTPINLSAVSRCRIQGDGRERTKLVCDQGVTAFNLDSGNGGTTVFNNEICDLTVNHNNSNTGATGAYGMVFGRNKTANVNNVYIRYFDKGVYLRNDTFYCKFVQAQIEDCNTGIHISNGADDRCNSNSFIGAKVLNNTDYALRITQGNENSFYGSQFENWGKYGIIMEGNLAESNFISGGRLESNSRNPTGYIYCGTGSKGNYISGIYVSGADYNATGYLTDVPNANWFEFPTYKGEYIKKTRNILTAGDFINYIRTGSGDQTSILKLYDSYPSAGAPNTFEVKCNRPASNLIRCLSSTDAELMRMKTDGFLYMGDNGNDGGIQIQHGRTGYYTQIKTSSTGILGFYTNSTSARNFSIASDSTCTMGTNGSDNGQLFLYGSATTNSGSLRVYNHFQATGANAYFQLRADNGKIAFDYDGSSTPVIVVDNTGRITAGGSDMTTTTKSTIIQSITGYTGPVVEYRQSGTGPMFNYLGATGATATTTISTLTTPGAVQGWLQIQVNNVKRWMPFYADPS